MDHGESCYRSFLSGNDKGLVELIEYYHDGLILYLCSIVKNFDNAEDLAMDTFAVLYADRPKFSGKSTFKTWLYSIARHVAADFIKKEARFGRVDYDSIPETADEFDLEEDYIKDEEHLNLRRAIGRINERYRQVLYLVYFEEFSNAEAAKIMGKTKKQVENLLFNAKKALREELEKEGSAYEEP